MLVGSGDASVTNGPSNQWRAPLAELFGTTVIVFAAVSAGPPSALSAIVSASAVGAMAASFAKHSGAHFNPAVSLAFWLLHRLRTNTMVLYIGAQMAGGCLGALTARSIHGVGSVVALAPAGLVRTAIWKEALLTLVLVSTIFLAIVDHDRDGDGKASPGPGIGFVYLMASVAVLAGLGASCNPARAFGPAFATQTWARHWVFWVGPALGAAVAALVAEYGFMAPGAGRTPRSRMGSWKINPRELGVAGLASYGVMNILYYSVALCVAWMRVDAGAAGASLSLRLAKVWAWTWAGSQVTKPVRLGLAVAMTPGTKRVLDALGRTRGTTDRAKVE